MHPDDVYRPPRQPVLPVFPEEPPGARSSRTLGIISIVLGATCAGGPFALALGVTGALLASKANRLGRENPDTYQPPSGMGFVTSIVGATLGVVGSLVLGLVLVAVFSAARARRQAQVPSAQERQVQIGEEARSMRDAFRGADGLVDADRLMVNLIRQDGEHPNPYTGDPEKLELGEHPSAAGRISVCQGYSSPYQGKNVPTLFIRSFPPNGRGAERTWIVRLE